MTVELVGIFVPDAGTQITSTPNYVASQVVIINTPDTNLRHWQVTFPNIQATSSPVPAANNFALLGIDRGIAADSFSDRCYVTSIEFSYGS